MLSLSSLPPLTPQKIKYPPAPLLLGICEQPIAGMGKGATNWSWDSPNGF